MLSGNKGVAEICPISDKFLGNIWTQEMWMFGGKNGMLNDMFIFKLNITDYLMFER
jgi:hypothetical protein